MPTSEATPSKFPLRMTEAERATVEEIQADAYEAGMGVSLNDVIRHMIRVSQFNVPATVADARAAIVAHWNDCRDCDATTKPRCLDGLHLQRAYARVAAQEARQQIVAARAAGGRQFQNRP
ncbi:hypothetical protein [Streptomyces sp. NPDC005093]